MSDYSSSNFTFQLWPNFPACLRVFTASFASYILLLPVFILVLSMGVHRWRKQRVGTTSTVTSHSDIITYNMAAIEVLCTLGSCFYCYGIYADHIYLIKVGLSLWSIVSPAQVLFYVFTCVEHYLAVVHPVTYRGLKVSRWVRIRNISIGCIWLVSFADPIIESFVNFSIISQLFFQLFSLLIPLVVICFCSISVLCTLLRTTPGEMGSNKGRVDQSKRRIVITLMAVTGALMLKCLSSLATTLLITSFDGNPVSQCLTLWGSTWFKIPSSLVLPLLFLQRVGKVPCVRHNKGSS